MSRIIVKNLPSGLKEERLRGIFSSEGHITDCSLKFTKEGKFRKFAFIGFSKEEEAENAVKHRHKSFIDTSRIQVEIAKSLGDPSKPRAWSKYSTDSSAFQKTLKKKVEEPLTEPPAKKQKKTSDDHLKDMLGELKDDPEFEEFVSLHQNKGNKATWSNDATGTNKPDRGDKVISDGESEEEEEEGDEDSGGSGEESEEESDTGEEEDDRQENEANKASISDLDYLKAKKAPATTLWSDSEDSESNEEDGEKDDAGGNDSDSGTSEEGSSDEDEKEESGSSGSSDEEEDSGKLLSKVEEKKFRFLIKMRGLPTNSKEGQIREFFKPVVPVSVKIPKNAKGKQSFCVATVEFKDESQQDAAMRKNKNYIGPKKIFLHKLKEKIKDETSAAPSRTWEGKDDNEEVESIGESGRLYVRNLAYICQEEDLETLFGAYGPLAEVHLPLDRFTRKIKGFAFVTFMMPEHAVKAHAELDGTNFQGRLLHILPGKPQKEDESASAESLSFKKKKEAQQKAQAGSSHNWNTLFLGANAVVDVMADKYGTKKSDILKAEGKESLGVRLALGETQVVAETRNFLVENGIALDSFSQAAAARSKTVLLAKNLPAGTQAEELQEMFSKFGTLGRIVLPPSGVTAVIEYLEPTEAKNGFQRLAYTRFKHLPLYLEWAPVDVFVKPAAAKTESEDTSVPSTTEQKEEEESSSSDEDEGETGRTLFVKNLNFDSTETSLKELFGSCGSLKAVSIAKKKDMKNPGQFLSMGYGFVEYKTKDSCQKALKTLQHSSLDEHQLELKLSNRATVQNKPVQKKKKQEKKKQKTSKILVRNIPFEAKQKEVQELFSVFGELKSVRMPKKLSGTGSHRGFAFVDFLTKQDAKRAFGALCHSTHLYGRRLVLEWANTDDDSVDYLRDKTAQHYHSGGPSKKLKKSGIMDELKLSTL